MPIYITVLVSQEESGLQIAFEIFCKILQLTLIKLMVEDFQVMWW